MKVCSLDTQCLVFKVCIFGPWVALKDSQSSVHEMAFPKPECQPSGLVDFITSSLDRRRPVRAWNGLRYLKEMKKRRKSVSACPVLELLDYFSCQVSVYLLQSSECSYFYFCSFSSWFGFTFAVCSHTSSPSAAFPNKSTDKHICYLSSTKGQTAKLLSWCWLVIIVEHPAAPLKIYLRRLVMTNIE